MLGNLNHVFFEMVTQIETHQAVGPRLHQREDTVFALELAQILAAFLHIEAFYGFIVPNLARPQRGNAGIFQLNAFHGITRQDIAHAAAPLHRQILEIVVENQFLELGLEPQLHAHRFSLPVGIGGKVKHLGIFGSLSEIVILVAGNAAHRKTFGIGHAVFAVAIDHVVNRAFIVALEHAGIHDVFSHKYLFSHLYHLEYTVAAENDDVVDIGAFTHVLVFLQTRADKTFGAVHIKFLVGGRHHIGLDILDIAQLGLAFTAHPVFFLDVLKISNRVIDQMCQMVLHFFHFAFHLGYLFIGFLDVELGNLAHRLFHQFHHIFFAHLTAQRLFKGLEGIAYRHQLFFPLAAVFFQKAVDAFFKEYLFEGGVIPFVFEFGQAYLQLLAQQLHGLLG